MGSAKKLTWAELRAEAFGEVGLRPWEFRRMGFRDYLETRRGHYARKTRDYDHQTTLFRALVTVVGGAAWGKASPVDESLLRRLLPLSGDPKESEILDARAAAYPTPEEIAETARRINAAFEAKI